MLSEPGFLAVTVAWPGALKMDPVALVERTGASPVVIRPDPSLTVVTWGLPPLEHDTVMLGRGVRNGRRAVDTATMRHLLLDRGSQSGLSDVLPPFAALSVDGARLVVGTDLIGARQVYVTAQPGWTASSTSSSLLAVCAGAGPDLEGLAVQRLLGWQLGHRTLFDSVRQLADGCVLTLRAGGGDEVRYASNDTSRWTLERAVPTAANVLRELLDAYLDDLPDITLQLSGGWDSRLLLSAIEPRRRRGLRAITLRVPGTQDAAIASDLACRFGLQHEIVTLDALDDLTPARAFATCRRAAHDLGGMSDPIALASLRTVEATTFQGPRLSGGGGEVARGFYYIGTPFGFPVTRRLTRILADWRLFTNESAPDHILEPEFAEWSRRIVLDDVHAALLGTGMPFCQATDEFYLLQRIQRCAGATYSAACFDREIYDPMLDPRFLGIARSLSPRAKRGSRYLSRLLIELDAELADIPLDNRPPPRVFASSSPANTSARIALTARKGSKKVSQRLRRAHRPPAGGAQMADNVVAHWREHPELLEGVGGLGIVRTEWLDELTSGAVAAEPSAVAFLLSLSVVAETCATGGSPV